MKRVPKTAALGLLLLCSVCWLSAQQDTSSQTAPDNTRINKRDRNQNEATADQQKENMSDRDLTRAIRRALEQDKSLSTKAHNVKVIAHNVKVIAQNGAVTLKGPVASDQEKQAVESKAAQIAGSDKVSSEIQVAHNQ